MRQILKQKINLKTGFFKTEPYLLLINQNLIKLIPEKDKVNNIFTIEFSRIKSLNLSTETPVEIEIRTDKDKFIGTMSDLKNLSKIIDFLSILLGKKFTQN